MLKSARYRLYGYRSGMIRLANITGWVEVIRKPSALGLLALLVLVSNVGSAQAAPISPEELREMGRFLSNNPLLVLAIILGLVLVIGRCLDLVRRSKEQITP